MRACACVGEWKKLIELSERDEILLNCEDAEAEQRMKAEVDEVLRTGDTVGGVFEVIAHGVPPGLGTYANWDERLDGLLAQAVMSLQAVKAVETRRCDHGGWRSRVESARRDRIFARRGIQPFVEPCRRTRRRRVEWARHRGARIFEADIYAAPSIRFCGFQIAGAGEGGV